MVFCGTSELIYFSRLLTSQVQWATDKVADTILTKFKTQCMKISWLSGLFLFYSLLSCTSTSSFLSYSSSSSFSPCSLHPLSPFFRYCYWKNVGMTWLIFFPHQRPQHNANHNKLCIKLCKWNDSHLYYDTMILMMHLRLV